MANVPRLFGGVCFIDKILCLFEITKNIVLLEKEMYNILKSKKMLEKKGFMRYTSIMSYSRAINLSIGFSPIMGEP